MNDLTCSPRPSEDRNPRRSYLWGQYHYLLAAQTAYRTLWTRWRTGFPGRYAGSFLMGPQSTSHWEVPKACYSPSLTVRSGPGHLHLKVASTLPKHIDAMSSMVITHLNLRCHVSGRVTIPQWHLWLGQGLPVPKVPPKKKSTKGQKKIDNQS